MKKKGLFDSIDGFIKEKTEKPQSVSKSHPCRKCGASDRQWTSAAMDEHGVWCCNICNPSEFKED